MDKYLSRRVVVTGIGLISPVGVGTDETWEALLRGQTGIAPITLFDARGLACQIAGEVKGFVSEDFIERKDLKKTGRFIQLTIAATDSAIEDSGLQINSENADRVGVYIVPKVLNVTIPKLPYLSLFRGPGCAVNKSQIFDFIEYFSIGGACECWRRTGAKLAGPLQCKRVDLRPLGKIRWREVRRVNW